MEQVCRRIERTTRGMLHKPQVLPVCSFRPGFQSAAAGNKNGHPPCGTRRVLYPRSSSIGLRFLVLGPSAFVDESDDFILSRWERSVDIFSAGNQPIVGLEQSLSGTRVFPRRLGYHRAFPVSFPCRYCWRTREVCYFPTLGWVGMGDTRPRPSAGSGEFVPSLSPYGLHISLRALGSSGLAKDPTESRWLGSLLFSGNLTESVNGAPDCLLQADLRQSLPPG